MQHSTELPPAMLSETGTANDTMIKKQQLRSLRRAIRRSVAWTTPIQLIPPGYDTYAIWHIHSEGHVHVRTANEGQKKPMQAEVRQGKGKAKSRKARQGKVKVKRESTFFSKKSLNFRITLTQEPEENPGCTIPPAKLADKKS